MLSDLQPTLSFVTFSSQGAVMVEANRLHEVLLDDEYTTLYMVYINCEISVDCALQGGRTVHEPHCYLCLSGSC